MKTNLLAAGGTESTINNPILGNTLQELVNRPSGGAEFLGKFVPLLVNLFFLVGALVFFFILISGAIQWIGAGGDKQSLENARTKITNALIGIIVLFAAYAIIAFIENFFDISILTLDIAPLVIK